MTRSAYDVFVAVGTDHHPFDRICAWIDTWAGQRFPQARCLVQHGSAQTPRLVASVPMLPHDEVVELMRSSTVIVCHGGPGTIMDARQAGRIPVVVPRRHDLGEHIDDHQIAFARRFAATGRIRLAESQSDLIELLDTALADPAWLHIAPDAPGREGIERVRAAVEQLGPRPSLRRHRLLRSAR